jgi:exopolysaccharide production protein ExoQ
MQPAVTRPEPDVVASRTARIYAEGGNSPIWEQILVTLWFFLTYIVIDGTSPVLYLLVGVFLVIMLLDKKTVVPVVLKSWPVFVLPAWAILSFLWSPLPAEAFRTGVLLFLTPLIIVINVARMDVRHVLRCLMFAGWITVFLVLPHWGELNTGGPYASKNYLAMQMNFMMLLSIAAALNARELLWVRLTAILFVPLGFMIVILSESATSLVFAIIGPVAIVAIKLFWVNVAGIGNLRVFILGAFLSIVLMIWFAIVNMPSNDFVQFFLEAIGRDSTLSGRQNIWAAGRAIQDQYPIFGTGANGFWYADNGAAQSINFYDFKPSGTVLTFHNAYMEVRVHFGWIGFGIYIFAWLWTAFRVLKSWLLSQHLEFSLLLVTTILIFIFTFTESAAVGTFNTPVNLLLIGAIATLGASRRQLVGRVPITIK